MKSRGKFEAGIYQTIVIVFIRGRIDNSLPHHSYIDLGILTERLLNIIYSHILGT